MLSNLKLEVIEKKLEYLRTILKKEGKYLSPSGMNLLNKQLSEVKAQLKEAQNRNVIGQTPEGLNVYLAPSEFDTFDGEVLYIEGLASGWDASSFDLTSGAVNKVVIDGGQEWFDSFTVK